jgi:hypothetical protein
VILPPEFDDDDDEVVGGGIPDDDGNIFLRRSKGNSGTDAKAKPKKPRK